MAMASAMAFGDITGGDVGALGGGSIASGRAIEEGREDDRGAMGVILSGEVRMGMFV